MDHIQLPAQLPARIDESDRECPACVAPDGSRIRLTVVISTITGWALRWHCPSCLETWEAHAGD